MNNSNMKTASYLPELILHYKFSDPPPPKKKKKKKKKNRYNEKTSIKDGHCKVLIIHKGTLS